MPNIRRPQKFSTNLRRERNTDKLSQYKDLLCLKTDGRSSQSFQYNH